MSVCALERRLYARACSIGLSVKVFIFGNRKKINNVTNYSAIKMGKCPRELFMTAETVTENIIDTDYPI